ncbi:MAG: acyl-CoA dehydrogenase family protein [Solirubrobacterales bacterium]
MASAMERGGVAGAASSLAPLVTGAATDAEAARALSDDVVAALREAGLFRMLAPSAIGGGEVEPGEAYRAIEAISGAHGSAGWCVAVGATAGLIAAFLDESAAAEIAGSPEAISCGVFAPKGRAVESGGELTVYGRWPLASGVEHANWVGLGCLVESQEGPPAYRYAIVPRGEVEVIDTWRALGLRATSSHDVAVEGAVVSLGRTTSLFTDRPRFDGPLYRFPVFGVLALSIAAVCTGIARTALDSMLGLAGEKTPAGSRKKLAERPTTQAAIGEAEASLRAARSLVDEAIGLAWEQASERDEVDVERRLGLRLAATNAARAGAAVTTTVHELAGVSGVYESSPLERAFRDVNVARRHLVVAPGTDELAGRLLLGLDTDTTQL